MAELAYNITLRYSYFNHNFFIVYLNINKFICLLGISKNAFRKNGRLAACADLLPAGFSPAAFATSHADLRARQTGLNII